MINALMIMQINIINVFKFERDTNLINLFHTSCTVCISCICYYTIFVYIRRQCLKANQRVHFVGTARVISNLFIMTITHLIKLIPHLIWYGNFQDWNVPRPINIIPVLFITSPEQIYVYVQVSIRMFLIFSHFPQLNKNLLYDMLLKSVTSRQSTVLYRANNKVVRD